MKKKLIVLSGFVLSLAPVVALAQFTTGGGARCPTNTTSPTEIGGILCKIGDLLNTIVPVIIILGVVYFIWGVITYVIAKEEEDKGKGRNRIIYGIIGLAVIVSMWGLVTILTSTFGVSTTPQT